MKPITLNLMLLHLNGGTAHAIVHCTVFLRTALGKKP